MDRLPVLKQAIGTGSNKVDTLRKLQSRQYEQPQRPRFIELSAVLLGLALAFWGGWALHSADEKMTELALSATPGESAVAPYVVPGSSTVPVRFDNKGEHNPIAKIAAAAVPSVVSIDTTMPAPGCPVSPVPRFFPFDFGAGHRPTEARGAGSGLIIRADGFILTNNHVVKNAETIRVTLSNNRTYCGQIVARDSRSDLALVKIGASHLPVARLGHSKNIRPGDYAIAIGTPMGLHHSVTMGIVSAIGRSLNGLNSNVELIQTDAAINPGNSGGPLLNIDGEVIGINMAIRSDAQNIGFSIPVDVAKDTARKMLCEVTAIPQLSLR